MKYNIVKDKDGNQYLKIGDKVLKVTGFKTVNGKEVPIIKAESEEIRHPDGRVDVVVKVPCLKINNKITQ